MSAADDETLDDVATVQDACESIRAAVGRLEQRMGEIAERTDNTVRAAGAFFLSERTRERDEARAEVTRLTAALAEATAQRDAARADHAAAEETLAGIVRVWQRADDDERRMADTFVIGLCREIEEARDNREGEWWKR